MRTTIGVIATVIIMTVGNATALAVSPIDGFSSPFPDPVSGTGHAGGLETLEEATTQSFSAFEGDRAQYHGGDVLYEPHVYAIFMGSNWNIPANAGIRAQLQNLYQEISGSAWQGILTQYFGKEGIVSHSVASTFYTDAAVQFSNPFYDEIHAEADKVAKSQGWSLSAANDQVVVLTSPGTFNGAGGGGYCAEHVTQKINGVTVSYSLVPYLGDPAFANCVGYGYGDPVKATSMAASHEYAESVSNPFFGGWSGPLHEEEIADLCVESLAQQLPGGGWVNELWDNQQGRCSLSDPNPPALHGVSLNSTGITTTEATLHGKVNPGGLGASYYFEYGTNPAKYEGKVPASPTSIGSGTADLEVSQTATGLKPGTVYHWRVTVTNPRGTTHGHDAKFTTEGPPVVTTAFPATKTTKNSATLNGTVNPNGKATSYYFEYGPTTAYGSKSAEVNVGSGTEDVPVSAEITGLTPSTLYHFRLVASNSYGTATGKDVNFITKASPPVVITGAADGISASKATVHGTVNPEGFETTYFVEYGETTYNLKTAEATLEAGSSPIDVSVSLSGLKEGTQYKYRLSAVSGQGSATDLSSHTFTTLKLPTANTEVASEVEKGRPRLNATINPNGSETIYQFEYGLTEAYGSMIPILPGAVGSGTSAVAVSKLLSGLKQLATYHYRVRAESDAGVAYGKDQTFTTVGATGSTDPATSIGATEATLNGTVNPKGAETKYQFEYGTTTSYGQVTPGEAKSAGGGGIWDVGVSQMVPGLRPLTSYHFRLVITNPDIGTVYGSDRTFTTGAELHWHTCNKQAGGKYTSSKCATEGAPNEWESALLKAGEKTTITAKGNPIAFTSVQAGVKTAFSCETEVASPSLENPTGGGNGVGGAEVKYKGCKPEGIAAEKGCKVENTANYASSLELTMLEGKVQAMLKPASGETFATFNFTGCTIGSLNHSYTLKGTFRGLYSNASSKIEFTTESTGASSLTLAGQKATAVGSIELTTSGGGYVKAESEVHWLSCTKQAGGKYTSSTCISEGAPNEWESTLLKAGEKTTIAAKGNPIAFTSVQAGVKTIFSCETEVASASLENPTGAGNGVGGAEVKYKGCKPEGIAAEKGCKVENTANYASKLEVVILDGKATVLLKPASGETFATFNFTGCTIGSLNHSYTLKGTFRGLYSNASSKIEFTTESTGESSLTLAGQKATAVGSIGLETTAGGYVRAG